LQANFKTFSNFFLKKIIAAKGNLDFLNDDLLACHVLNKDTPVSWLDLSRSSLESPMMPTAQSDRVMRRLETSSQGQDLGMASRPLAPIR
jgi:hypothetical protein